MLKKNILLILIFLVIICFALALLFIYKKHNSEVGLNDMASGVMVEMAQTITLSLNTPVSYDLDKEHPIRLKKIDFQNKNVCIEVYVDEKEGWKEYCGKEGEDLNGFGAVSKVTPDTVEIIVRRPGYKTKSGQNKFLE